MGEKETNWNSVLNRCADKEVPYGPGNIDPYRNTRFETKNSFYTIEDDMTLIREDKNTGSREAGGSKVLLIAGIDPAVFNEEYHRLGWRAGKPRPKEIGKLVENHGRKIREGDRMVLATVSPVGNKRTLPGLSWANWYVTTLVLGIYDI